MATVRWTGSRGAVAQVDTITVAGTVANGDTVTVTINGKDVTYTVTAADAAAGSPALSVAENFAVVLAACTNPEFTEIDWSNDATNPTVVATANTAGVPFTLTAGDTGTTTFTRAATTANAGPNVVTDLTNYSGGALPTTGDTFLIDGGPDLLYDFANLPADAWAALRIKASFEGRIGLPYLNANGYPEYRTRFLTVATTIATTIGEGVGGGPVRVNIASGNVLAVVVLATGQRESPAVPVVNIKGCTSGVLSVISGDVSLAADDDTTSATVTTVTINDGATLTVGTGATVTTLNQDGGTVTAYGVVTTLNIIAGSATLYGSPTTITADGGTVAWRGTGAVTTATFRGQGAGAASPVLDCTQDPRARTVTNGSFTGGANLQDPDKTITMSNAFTFDRASLTASDLGTRFTLTRT